MIQTMPGKIFKKIKFTCLCPHSKIFSFNFNFLASSTSLKKCKEIYNKINKKKECRKIIINVKNEKKDINYQETRVE